MTANIMFQKIQSVFGVSFRLFCYAVFGLLLIVPVVGLLVCFGEQVAMAGDLLSAIGDFTRLFTGASSSQISSAQECLPQNSSAQNRHV